MSQLTEFEKEIKKIVAIEFCKYLALTNSKVCEAMNSMPCPLGSEKHFEATAKAIAKKIKESL